MNVNKNDAAKIPFKIFAIDFTLQITDFLMKYYMDKEEVFSSWFCGPYMPSGSGGECAWYHFVFNLTYE